VDKLRVVGKQGTEALPRHCAERRQAMAEKNFPLSRQTRFRGAQRDKVAATLRLPLA